MSRSTDLAPITDATLLRALGLRPSAGLEIEEQLTESLRGAQLLMVVDNLWEHLVDHSALLGRLLMASRTCADD